MAGAPTNDQMTSKGMELNEKKKEEMISDSFLFVK